MDDNEARYEALHRFDEGTRSWAGNLKMSLGRYHENLMATEEEVLAVCRTTKDAFT